MSMSARSENSQNAGEERELPDQVEPEEIEEEEPPTNPLTEDLIKKSVSNLKKTGSYEITRRSVVRFHDA